MNASRPTRSAPAKKARAKKPLKQAFVVTAAAVGALAAGCDADITNPPYADCPTTVPGSGSACSADLEGASCPYDDPCAGTVTATCTDGAWALSYDSSCNPPPPEECPVDRPLEGEACAPAFVPDTCDYPIDAGCGAQTVTLACNLDPITSTQIWQVTVRPTCDAPVIDCTTLDVTLCQIHTACRYLTPGCSDEPPPVGFETGGCFAADDCTVAGCATDQTCTVVTYNPCWNSECAACGADASVCLPAQP